MLTSYFHIGLRNIQKSKVFSIINIGGMAISIASFLLIGLFMYDEWKFDQNIPEVGQKYRVFNEYYRDQSGVSNAAMVPPMIGATLASDFPEVDYAFRFMNIQSALLFVAGDKRLTETNGGYADPTVFDMFGLKLLEGNVDMALKGPSDIALSKSLKEKYFGNENALGKSIEVAGTSFSVAAVYDDADQHMHFQMNYFLPMEAVTREIPERMQSWMWSQFHTYIKLKPGSEPASLERKFLAYAEKNIWPVTKPEGFYYVSKLMPVSDVHLYASDQRWDVAKRGNIQTMYILAGTALFIIFISILNFINLSTARAINRMKEVGVRKVAGAQRSQLIFQFTTEAVVMTAIALLVALAIIISLLPLFNDVAEKNLSLMDLVQLKVIAAIFSAVIVIGILAGVYPAFILSAHKPLSVLPGRSNSGGSKLLLRQGLVVVQFVISCLLIIGTWVVNDQHNFMRNTDIGFDKENLLVLPLRDPMLANTELVKKRFLESPGIENATLGYGLPGEAFAGDGIIDHTTKKRLPVSMLLVDEGYIPTLGLELLAGRNFSEGSMSDFQHAFIISETTAKMLGYQKPSDALEHELAWPRWEQQDSLKVGRVIGVVKDLQLNSMREVIGPVVLQIAPLHFSTLTLKLSSPPTPAMMAELEARWKTFGSSWPFEYHFLDANYDTMYRSEEKLSKLFTGFSTFTIIVACLGLFGLVMYSTSQRNKEIGIRKVLGAEERGLVLLLSRSYLLLLLIAFVIAIPLGYYAASTWLENFVFRIDLSPMLFVKSAAIIAMIAITTVVFQSLKAARSNPVKVLRSE
jgi:putative ABC transport system permease protein